MNCCHCTERPKPTVTIKPAQHVFRGETVTLRCDIYDEGVTSWSHRWYKEGSVTVFSELQEHTFSSVTESLTQVNTPVMDQRQKDHAGHIRVIKLH